MTTTESGNELTGAYSRTVTGTDTYTLGEVGTNTGGTTEAITGTDGYTLAESGNAANRERTPRTVTGSGTYTRTDSGAGATLGSGSGAIGYTATESTDERSGDFSESETGSDRYALLEHFNNVANTGGGNTPGNMNFLPVGERHFL